MVSEVIFFNVEEESHKIDLAQPESCFAKMGYHELLQAEFSSKNIAPHSDMARILENELLEILYFEIEQHLEELKSRNARFDITKVLEQELKRRGIVKYSAIHALIEMKVMEKRRLLIQKKIRRIREIDNNLRISWNEVARILREEGIRSQLGFLATMTMAEAA